MTPGHKVKSVKQVENTMGGALVNNKSCVQYTKIIN